MSGRWHNPDPTPRASTCTSCGQPVRTAGKGHPRYEPNSKPRREHECPRPQEIAVTVTDIDAFLGVGTPERDRWDRPLIVPPEGGEPVPYTRVSTFAGALDDAGGLVTWKGRMAARGIAQREDLAAMVAGLKFSDEPDDRKRRKADAESNALLDSYVETAICSVDDKAAWGTAVHSFTEPDPSPHVPLRMQADVGSYFEALDAHGLVCVQAERFVVHDELRVAGTFDGIWEHPVLGRMLGDKKTGRLKAQAVAVQLACYAGAQLYTADPVTRTALDVRQDIGLLFHIPKGTGKTEVYTVDLEAGRTAAKAAQWVRAWRDREDLLNHFDPLSVASLAS